MSEFQTFELVAKEPVSSTASIFTIKPKEKLRNAKDFTKAWKTGIWNVRFKQPQLQIVRAYTPLPPVDDADDVTELRFLIRQDARGGEMSTYLHRLPVGAMIELRGPNVEYPIADGVKNIIFIAGGTGIAPALQVAHAMFDGLSMREQQKKHLHILWGNRAREDCEGGPISQPRSAESTETGYASWAWAIFGPRSSKSERDTAGTQEDVQDQRKNGLVQQLEELKAVHSGRISVSYFVDEDKSFITSNSVREALDSLKLPSSPTAGTYEVEDTQVIISGPPGFITYLAGPKVRQDGEEKQGPLGGRLAQVLDKNERNQVKVWKV